MKKVLFENGSEQVVDYGKDGIYVDGAGYHFKVIGIGDNDFWVTGKVRKETKEFIADYFTKQELDMDEKEVFINELIKDYVHENDEQWLKEQIEDYEDWEIPDQYFNDVSLSEMVNYIYDIFAYTNTRAEIQHKMNEFLGHYSPSMLAKVDDAYYLFFQ